MAVPPLGSTGLDKSDPATFGTGKAQLAPSSMSASEGFRDAVSAVAPDRSMDDDDDMDAAGAGLDAGMALSLLRDASGQSKSFFESFVHASWQRSYRAVRNEHFSNSIYLTDAYKTRSKIFKPKTRSALHKRLATTSKALFTPGDVVSVQPEDESNPQQIASAALKQELLNYRLRTATLRNGIPWFQIAIGARFDADVTSICASKQFWNYKEIDTGETEIVESFDEETGASMQVEQPKMMVLIDKPDVMLIPPENIRFDPNCNWTNVAQLSSFLLLQFPMTADEAWTMIQQNQRANVPWLSTITRDMIRNQGSTASPSETTGPRTAREGGRDPKQQSSGAFRTVWLTEVFMRYEGRDYVYWALNDTTLLSTPTPVEQVYPWCYGERPIVIGMGQLEPHRTYQMSAVEAWQQSQQEVNDLANLRLDREKQVVAPPIKVLRGKKVDLAQVQRKGPNSILMLNDMADVEPLELADVPGSLFNEATMLNNDIDDLSGNFDGASVQSNREMNETVGGMHLLSESANIVGDFHLSIWAETWAQPVVIQILKLEEWYETDARVLAICGQRAKLWERHGVSDITDQFLKEETTASVNIGIGATTLPMERLKRFSTAWDTFAKAAAPFVAQGKQDVVPNLENICNDIFSAANFKDGGQRYFQYIGPPQQPAQPPPPDPKAQAAMLGAQAKMQGNQIQQEKNQGSMLIEARKLNDTQSQTQQKLIGAAHDRMSAVEIAHMKAMAEVESHQRDAEAAAGAAGMAHAHDHAKAMMSPFMQRLAAQLNPPPPTAPGGAGGKQSGVQMAAPPAPWQQPQPGLYDDL